MKRRRAILSFLVGVLASLAVVGCTEDEKEFIGFVGDYLGNTNSLNPAVTRAMKMTITSEGNPVVGSYTLSGGGTNDAGTVSGSVLGLILDLKFKSNVGGPTYTFSGNIGDENATVKGTMSGMEAGKTVTYTVDLKKK
ncbi:hypothetical protein [Larkinella punicea]|uniref:hypothetical protein n=1 Tax=Larkinella punicea TaxID=2315727 RepID=UPI00105856F8|nr:hypothetical protein [Larkinella punicea]